MKKLTALILVLICVPVFSGCSSNGGPALPDNVQDRSNSNPLGDGDDAVFEPHREDFSPEIESAVLEQFDNGTEVKKAYILRTNSWYLSDDMSDFSQAVTTDAVYIAPGGEDGAGGDMAYSSYTVDENGEIKWGSSAYPREDAPVPSGFSGLTYEIIENALAGIEYEDYIITYAQRMNTVFVWARCESGDVIVTYPTRPDLLGIEIGGIYTLEEVKAALTEAHSG